jgi:hypothetical protein
MAQARQRAGLVSRVLNSDGRTHPMENVLALATLGLGLVAVLCGLIESLHILGAWAGAAGLITGAISQMWSVTLAERWINVIGWVLAFVGLVLSMANGGFA